MQAATPPLPIPLSAGGADRVAGGAGCAVGLSSPSSPAPVSGRRWKEAAVRPGLENIDITVAVEELSGLASRELNKLLKDSENFTIQCDTGKGSSRQIDVEKLASSLPLHLIAVLLSPDMDMHLGHLLRGVRLLHTLSDLASRHNRLEQILLDDVKVSEQIMDLVFFMLIVLARCQKVNHVGTCLPFLHSALVACSLHLLPGYISSQWHDLVLVLLAHPKVDIFMDIAYDAVHVDIRFLHIKLSALNNDVLCNKFSLPAAERTAHYLCQQCEASLQFLLSLCQQKLFRDRLLKNKELCKNGGILSLARTILKLNIPDCFKGSFDIVAIISRIKAKILSILLQLSEAETISYLDEVAGSSKSMRLAKFVALEILDLLKSAFRKEAKRLSDSPDRSNPKGLVLLNSLRLADIFSDDSNFRSFFMTNAIEVLVEILATQYEEFLSSWCSVDIAMIEEDANVDYDPFTAAGVALVSFIDGRESALSAPVLLNETNSACPSILNGVPSVTYAQQRTSYLVKIIANLHCYIPNICEEEERNLFLNKFHECLLAENPGSFSSYPSSSHALRAVTICKNLSSLSNHAASLIPNLLNEEDVQLLRLFLDQLQKLIPRQIGDNLIQESFLKGVEGIIGNQVEDRNRTQQPMLSWIKFPNSNFTHQDAQSIEKYAPSLLTKLDGSAQEEAPNFKDNDVDIKRGISKNPLGQELDQNIVKSKLGDLPDDFDLTQNRRKNIPSTTRSGSGSLGGIENDIQNFEMKGIEQNSKGNFDPISDIGEVFRMREHAKESAFQEDDKAESVQGEEKQPRKRKRNIMNEKQIILIENALLEEPEMQRNAAMLQSWADTLSSQGSEITSSQLKNWLNNRKARLARIAREARASSEGENIYTDKFCGPNTPHYYDSPDSGGDEYYIPSSRASSLQCIPKSSGMVTRAASAEDHEMIPPSDLDFAAQHDVQMSRPPVRTVPFEPSQLVSVVDAEGTEVGKGKVFQVDGRWHGKSLEDGVTACVVDVTELKIERWKSVPHPLEAAGTTFEEAVARNGGAMRVAWDADRIFPLPQ